MDTSTKIKERRIEKNYSQKYMADILDISQSYYNKIENGQASLNVDKLISISKELEIEPSELLSSAEKGITNNFEINKGQIGSGNTQYIGYTEEERKLYKEQIELLKEENIFLRNLINKLEVK